MQSKAMSFELPVILSKADQELIAFERPHEPSNRHISLIYLEDAVSIFNDDEAENWKILYLAPSLYPLSIM
jgi:hypothetical protein